MKQTKKAFLFILIAFVALMKPQFSEASCNWSCDIRTDYPCPTWSVPLRICEGHSDEPVCHANRKPYTLQVDIASNSKLQVFQTLNFIKRE